MRIIPMILSLLLAALVVVGCGPSAEPEDPAAVPTVTGLPSAPESEPPSLEGTSSTPEGYPAPEQEPTVEGYPAPTELPTPEGYPDPSAEPTAAP